MSRAPQDITKTELAVLQVLWDEGSSTIRRITDILYPRGGTSHYATVQKLLDRLQEKHFVQRDRQGNINVFSACVNKEELIGQRLQSVAEQLCGGSMTPLLTNLVQNQRLSAEDRQQLRNLIDELDKQANPKKGPSK